MGWMSKLFGSDDEIGPEEKHRRAAEAKKDAEGEHHRPAAKKTAARKTVPSQSRASHSHDDEPKRTSSPLHPTKSAATGPLPA